MIRINLLPVRELKRSAMLRQQLYLFGAILSVVAIVIAALWITEQSAIATLESEKMHLQAQLEQLKPVVDEVSAMERREQLLNARLQTIQRLRRNQRGPVRVLDELSRNLPEQAWLEAIDEASGTYKVTGYALTNFAVADLLRNLQHSAEFTAVDLLSSEQAVIASQAIKKFIIQFQRAGSQATPPALPSTVQRKPGA